LQAKTVWAKKDNDIKAAIARGNKRRPITFQLSICIVMFLQRVEAH